MKMSELTKYQKSRMCKCIYCGHEITENQDFQFCTTRYKRFNIYTFIHSDCMVKANKLVDSIPASAFINVEEDFNDGK